MTSWVMCLIIANAIVYLLSMLQPAVREAFAFVPAHILEQPWTLITYMFLHAKGFGHIVFNMLGLLFFGPRLEAFLGGKRFLFLYFFSGLVAALTSCVLSPQSSIIGASGAVYGVFLGFARMWPREIIRIWGVFPIEARWMAVLMTALSLFGGLGMTGGNIAHFAHLGGFIGAYIYLRFLERSLAQSSQRKETRVQISKGDLARWSGIDRARLHEVNREEYDRIRQKLDQQAGTITEGERQFLDRFSQTGR